jgi:hypothetical protein
LGDAAFFFNHSFAFSSLTPNMMYPFSRGNDPVRQLKMNAKIGMFAGVPSKAEKLGVCAAELMKATKEKTTRM